MNLRRLVTAAAWLAFAAAVWFVGDMLPPLESAGARIALSVVVGIALLAWEIFRTYRRVAASAHIPYTDQAMIPVSEDDTQKLELFTHSKSARDAVDHARKIKILTGLTSTSAQSPA